MSTAFGGLVGLLAGFLLGLGLAAVPTPATGTIVGIFATIGAIFIDLIRMTVLPLVTSLLISSLGAAAGSSGLGRAGIRAVIGGAILLTAAITLSLAVARPLLDRVQVDRDAAIALRNASTPAEATPGPGTLPTIAQWARELVPVNVIRSAADGLILPVVIFAVMFGLALAKLESSRRDPVLGVAAGVAEVMQRLVAGLLRAAPVGIFALAVPLASGLGMTAAVAVFAYIGLVVGLTATATLLLYPLAMMAGPLPLPAFASYCAPAQALAFTARSSLAALPWPEPACRPAPRPSCRSRSRPSISGRRSPRQWAHYLWPGSTTSPWRRFSWRRWRSPSSSPRSPCRGCRAAASSPWPRYC
jgi:Na+/H+-dicarboxylate symporter